MNRIPLNYTQRQSLQSVRKDIETRIRETKKLCRGAPHHIPESSDAQMALAALKKQAHAIYTLIAGARGREHAPKRTEKTLEALRAAAKSYTTYSKDRRPPGALEALGLLLLEVEATTAEATAA